jgi:hypothetical protein
VRPHGKGSSNPVSRAVCVALVGAHQPYAAQPTACSRATCLASQPGSAPGCLQLCICQTGV